MSNYDLEKRTLEFSVKLIKTLKQLPKDLYNYKLTGQLISSGTSIGANYMEANGAESRKDFVHKIRISLKESKETRYWLDILIRINHHLKDVLYDLRKEANEFVLIFGKITSNSK
ncbi:four helix bundle protein [Patescibacteria group bacterium]|nr:four helix bundle protein [Patescibacteria group bacterium]